MAISSVRVVNATRKVSPRSAWSPIGSFFLLASKIASSIGSESVRPFTRMKFGILSRHASSHIVALKEPTFTMIFKRIFY